MFPVSTFIIQIFRVTGQSCGKIPDTTGVPALRTDGECFSDTENVILNAVNYLHKAGFTILMDDFGSGYSSLNVLKDIDLDVLKIDMKFLSKGKDDGRGEKILAAVIQMAKALDMPVIAEGVEEKKQVQMLKRLGCNYIQGYYFAKPMPQEDYERLARNRMNNVNR